MMTATGRAAISRKTVGRLSLYRRLLHGLRDSGATSIYSHQLADLAGVSATVVRRDLMVIGYTGSPNRGYDVDTCITSINRFFAGATYQEIALVGVGRLGQALLAHFSEYRPVLQETSTGSDGSNPMRPHRLLHITAAFDTNPGIVGTMVSGCPVYDMSELENVVTSKGIRVGIIAVPAGAAQEVATTLVRAGVLSIVTFTAAALQVPEEVFVDYVDITSMLESAAFFAQEGASKTPQAEESADTEVDPIIRKIDSLLEGAGMELEELAERIGAEIIVPGRAGATVTKIYAGDRVSDLLHEASQKTLLVTKLANLQMVRVAELIDVPGICFVDGNQPSEEIIELAENSSILLMVSPLGIFETCGLIFQNLSSKKSA